jgi:hypothetical protein
MAIVQPTFEIVSYVGVKPLLFGMTEAQVEKLLGRPLDVIINDLGERDVEYKNFSLRYSREDATLVEVGLLPRSNVTIRGIDLFNNPKAFETLLREDSCPLEVHGFVVLLNLGITLTGFHDNDPSQLAATAFVRGRWDHLKPKLKKFSSWNAFQ